MWPILWFLLYSCLSTNPKNSIGQIDSVVIFQGKPTRFREEEKNHRDIENNTYIYVCVFFFRSLKQRGCGYRSRDTNPISYRHYAAAYKNRTVVERVRGINLDHGFFPTPDTACPFFLFLSVFPVCLFVCLFFFFFPREPRELILIYGPR